MPRYTELSHHGEIRPEEILRSAEGPRLFPVGSLAEVDERIREAMAAGGGWLLGRFPPGEINAVVGHAPQIDEDACRERGIPVYRLEHLYGPVILFPGDLTLVGVSRRARIPDRETVKRGLDLLRERGIDAGTDGNDLITDGKKTASGLSCRLGDWVLTGLHFSVDTDAALVERLCLKPVRKRPGALRDYGITAEGILDWLEKEGVLHA